MTREEELELGRNAIELAPGNNYGSLTISKAGDKYYWSVECWNGYVWLEIMPDTYLALITQKQKDDIDG